MQTIQERRWELLSVREMKMKEAHTNISEHLVENVKQQLLV